MRLFPVLTSVALLLLGSCTGNIPETANFPYSEQQKLQASRHWQIVAHDLANRINNELIMTDKTEASVYIRSICDENSNPCKPYRKSSFNEAFHDLLITGMVDYGIPTRNQPEEDSLEIQYNVQLVHHITRRTQRLQPGILTALSATIVVLRDAPAELLIIAGGIIADIANTNLRLNDQYEVIITTSILDKDKYLFRASDIYYINDKDFYQFQDTVPMTKSIQLSAGYNASEDLYMVPETIKIRDLVIKDHSTEHDEKNKI